MKTDLRNHRFELRKVKPETLKIIDFQRFFIVSLIFEFSNISMDFKWILVVLGGSWAPLGASCGRLRGVLDASWRVLGASWGVLGASCRVLGFLEASWAVLEAFWAPKPPQDKPDLTWNGKRRAFF